MIVSLLLLLYVFLKIGLFSFGGGLAMIPIIFQSVDKYDMISVSEFANILALSQMTPGPMVINVATYIGFESSGILGAIVATVGVAVPSFVVVIVAIKFFKKFEKSNIVQGMIKGIRPATVGLIATSAVFLVGEMQISTASIIFFVITIVAFRVIKINPIIIIAIMALIGGLLC